MAKSVKFMLYLTLYKKDKLFVLLLKIFMSDKFV